MDPEEQARTIVDNIINLLLELGGHLVANTRHSVYNRPDTPEGLGEEE